MAKSKKQPSEASKAKARVKSSSNARKKQKKDPPNFSDPGALVTFLIGKGDEPKKFLVHKEFACYHSPVLDAAFKSEFIEGQTQTYRIDDIMEGTFRLFVQWVYGEKITLGNEKNQAGDEEDKGSDADSASNLNHEEEDELENGMEGENFYLVELWILADRLCIPRLQNYALDTIHSLITKTNEVPTPCLSFIYKRTSEGSPLRNFFVDQVATGFKGSVFLHHSYRFPQPFLIEVIVRVKNALPKEHVNLDAKPVTKFYVSVRTTSRHKITNLAEP